MNWTNHFGGAENLSRISDGRRGHNGLRPMRVDGFVSHRGTASRFKKSEKREPVSQDLRALARISQFSVGPSASNAHADASVLANDQDKKRNCIFFPNSRDLLESENDSELTRVEQFSSSSFFRSQEHFSQSATSSQSLLRSTQSKFLSPVSEGLEIQSQPSLSAQQSWHYQPRKQSFTTKNLFWENNFQKDSPSAADINTKTVFTYGNDNSEGLSESGSDCRMTEAISSFGICKPIAKSSFQTSFESASNFPLSNFDKNEGLRSPLRANSVSQEILSCDTQSYSVIPSRLHDCEYSPKRGSFPFYAANLSQSHDVSSSEIFSSAPSSLANLTRAEPGYQTIRKPVELGKPSTSWNHFQSPLTRKSAYQSEEHPPRKDMSTSPLRSVTPTKCFKNSAVQTSSENYNLVPNPVVLCLLEELLTAVAASGDF